MKKLRDSNQKSQGLKKRPRARRTTANPHVGASCGLLSVPPERARFSANARSSLDAILPLNVRRMYNGYSCAIHLRVGFRVPNVVLETTRILLKGGVCRRRKDRNHLARRKGRRTISGMSAGERTHGADSRWRRFWSPSPDNRVAFLVVSRVAGGGREFVGTGNCVLPPRKSGICGLPLVNEEV